VTEFPARSRSVKRGGIREGEPERAERVTEFPARSRSVKRGGIREGEPERAESADRTQ